MTGRAKNGAGGRSSRDTATRGRPAPAGARTVLSPARSAKKDTKVGAEALKTEKGKRSSTRSKKGPAPRQVSAKSPERIPEQRGAAKGSASAAKSAAVPKSAKASSAGKGAAAAASSSSRAARAKSPVRIPQREIPEPRGASKGSTSAAKSAGVPKSAKASSAGKGTAAAASSSSRAAGAKSPLRIPQRGVGDCRARVPESPSEPGGAPQSHPAPRRRLSKNLQNAVNAVRLSAVEVSQVADFINPRVEELIRGIRQHETFKGVEKLTTGSYYEKVKISKPDEFDIMLKMSIKRIRLEPFPDGGGAFYYVKFPRMPSGNPLQNFIDENESLSADKMLTELRQQITELVKDNEDISVERKKAGSPAVTLLIKKPKGGEISVDIVLALEIQMRWPDSTKEGLDITEWLGSKARQEYRLHPFYLVPKSTKDGQKMKADTWRISFSHIEKDILRKHGKERTCCEKDGQKCCRKKCLKMLKHLMDNLKRKHEKGLDGFCSYHAKTIAFHAFAKRPNDSQWKPDDLEDCFDKLIEDFVDSLKNEELKNVFIPSFNLYSQELIKNGRLQFLVKKLEYEKKNRYPIFAD